MIKINENFLKLQDSYLFSTIAKKVNEYKAQNPDKEVISLGIGDVTQPLCAPVIEAYIMLLMIWLIKKHSMVCPEQ